MSSYIKHRIGSSLGVKLKIDQIWIRYHYIYMCINIDLDINIIYMQKLISIFVWSEYIYILLGNVSQKPIVKLLTVEQPSIVIDLLINKIYLASSS